MFLKQSGKGGAPEPTFRRMRPWRRSWRQFDIEILANLEHGSCCNRSLLECQTGYQRIVTDDIDEPRDTLGIMGNLSNSLAHKIVVRAAGEREALLLSVADDGTGGADPARGSGLSGLAQRVAVVDGRLTIVSPPEGPTTITVELPLRA